jgi:hypothetical protein
MVATIRSSPSGIFHKDTEFMHAVLSKVGHHSCIPSLALHRIFDLMKNKDIKFTRLESQISGMVKRHVNNEIEKIFEKFMESAANLSNRKT